MNYFIDGDFEIPIDINSDEDCLHSCLYSSKNSGYVSTQLSPQLQKEINTSAFDEVVAFYNSRIPIFKNFEKKIGIDIWFFEQFRLYFTYRTFLLKQACITQFLENNPSGIVISTDENLSHFINPANLKLIAALKRSSTKKSSSFKELKFMLSHFKWGYKQAAENLIISRIEDDFDGKDQRFGSLQDNSDKIINRDLFNSAKELPHQNVNYNSKNNVDSLFIRNLLTISGGFSILKFNKQLKLLFQEINKTTVESSPKEKVISHIFQKNKISYIIYFLKYKSFCWLFKKTAYQSVMFINENSAQQKAIQYAAFQNGVKVFAIQHGAIYDLHPAYMFGKYKTPPLLPNITFTWGKYFTELLKTKGGYNNNQVLTAGRIVPTNIVRKKHHAFDSKNDIILYATQPQPDQRLRAQELSDVFKAAKHHSSRYLLVLRPHPAEQDDRFFNSIAESVNFSDFIIDRESDLQTQFECCSMLITSYSTVGAEFVPYNKPLLVLDYLKADLVNYIKQGVGLPIYSDKDLIETLEQETITINTQAYALFTENYFYNKGEDAIEIIWSKTRDLK